VLVKNRIEVFDKEIESEAGKLDIEAIERLSRFLN
jgi:hypothetical protein